MIHHVPGRGEWYRFYAPAEHALKVGFVNQALGPGARVAVELAAAAARALAQTLLSVLDNAEAGGFAK